MKNPATNHLALALTLALATITLRADVTLGMPFGSDAVFQRDKPIVIQGQADPGERVTVEFASHTATATADASGHWRARLPALPASATPAQMIVTGKNQIVLDNILVGDVWLCSGQSNMEWNLARDANAREELAAANHPAIRFVKIDRAVSAGPAAAATGSWRVCTPRTAGVCSAVAYYFARDVHKATGVPVGIIQSSWSGAQIESYIPAPALASAPAFAPVTQRWRQTLAAYPEAKNRHDADQAAWEKARDEATAKNATFNTQPPRPPVGPGHRDQPSGLYNAMIAPLAPCGLRGFLWYQGEGNAQRFDEYRALFAAMINSWRAAFAQGDLPFYWVQLPNYKAGRGDARMRAFLREAQDQTLALPNTGQAVTIDVGNPDDEHPAAKEPVGHRLALLALAKTHGLRVACESPRFVSARPEGAAMRVTLAHAEGLAARAAAAPSFEVAGADQEFFPASAKIENATLLVSSPKVPAPVAVRYAWFNDPRATLHNAAGLPLAPFRSDAWEPLDVSRTSATAPDNKGGNARFLEMHRAFLDRAKQGPVGLLFIGDSITEGWTKAPEIWENYFARHQPANFGISGDSTQHVLWRIANGELDDIRPRLVVLMIGTNNSGVNTPAEITAGVKLVVSRIREKLPASKILLLAIFPRGPRRSGGGAFDDAIARKQVIDTVNQNIARLDDGRTVRFLDIGRKFLDADGKIPSDIMPDQLHPGPKGYEIWAEAIAPLVDAMMRE